MYIIRLGGGGGGGGEVLEPPFPWLNGKTPRIYSRLTFQTVYFWYISGELQAIPPGVNIQFNIIIYIYIYPQPGLEPEVSESSHRRSNRWAIETWSEQSDTICISLLILCFSLITDLCSKRYTSELTEADICRLFSSIFKDIFTFLNSI